MANSCRLATIVTKCSVTGSSPSCLGWSSVHPWDPLPAHWDDGKKPKGEDLRRFCGFGFRGRSVNCQVRSAARERDAAREGRGKRYVYKAI